MRIVYCFLFVCFLLACKDRKNASGTRAGGSDCHPTPSDALLELRSLHLGSVADTLFDRVRKTLGPEVLKDDARAVFYDTLSRMLFPMQFELAKKHYQLDTTDLLLLKNPSEHYLQDPVQSREHDWRRMLNIRDFVKSIDNGRYRVSFDVEPCLLGLSPTISQHKLETRGQSMPHYARGMTYVDRVYGYDCRLRLTIVVNVQDLTGLRDGDRHTFRLGLTDSARLYTHVDLRHR